MPGAFELPLAANGLVRSGRIDAVVCVGCVIRGETAHFEHVATQCATGIQQVVAHHRASRCCSASLTVETLEQALARSEPAGGHNVGEEAALGAVEMARLLQAALGVRQPDPRPADRPPLRWPASGQLTVRRSTGAS